MSTPLHHLVLAFVLVAAPWARAQEKAAGPATQAAQNLGPLGDTSKFSRMGGWGGFGSGMAQFGVAKAMLLMMPAVQKELKMTEAQVKAVREWGDQLRTKGEAMFRNPGQAQGQGQGQGQAANPGPGANPTDPNTPAPPGENPGGGPPNPMAMLEMVSSLVREGETGLAKILDRKQIARLNQISLQMEGVAALGRPEVAQAIYLADDQVETIQQILTEAKAQQFGLMFRQGFAMRGRRGNNADAPPRPPGAGDDANAPRPAEPAKADARDDEDPEARAKRRQAEREKARAEFAKFRDSSDQIQAAATEKILRVLAKKQRERFEKLLGEPFDPAKLAGPGGLGGPPRPEPPATADAKPAEPAKKAPAKSTRLRDARLQGRDATKP